MSEREICRLWAPPRHRPPRPPKPISSWVRLEQRMRGAPLIKTCRPPGNPLYAVSGVPCSPALVENAIRWRLIVPLDRDLFDDRNNAQSYQLKEPRK
jgi:hypothetical protein